MARKRKSTLTGVVAVAFERVPVSASTSGRAELKEQWECRFCRQQVAACREARRLNGRRTGPEEAELLRQIVVLRGRVDLKRIQLVPRMLLC